VPESSFDTTILTATTASQVEPESDTLFVPGLSQVYLSLFEEDSEVVS